MRTQQSVVLVTVVTGILMIGGCRIDSNKQGDHENVKIATPFGGVSVKTNDASVEQGLGLAIYPGAELVKKDKNNGSADVNLSFGKFQLRVKAASYRTPDSTDKVQAFYMNALKRYGTVIQCSHDKPIGTPIMTDEGLTCDEHGKAQYNGDTDTSGKVELKAGSKQHQHIVGIDPEGSGTKFGVVALDLPGNITVDGDQRQ